MTEARASAIAGRTVVVTGAASGIGRALAAESPGSGMSAYGASKAALWALTRTAAKETGDADILINGLIPGPTNTAIWGRDMPRLQPPEAVYPTALQLATLPPGGPSGQVFWDGQLYPLMAASNPPPAR